MVSLSITITITCSCGKCSDDLMNLTCDLKNCQHLHKLPDKSLPAWIATLLPQTQKALETDIERVDKNG